MRGDHQAGVLGPRDRDRYGRRKSPSRAAPVEDLAYGADVDGALLERLGERRLEIGRGRRVEDPKKGSGGRTDVVAARSEQDEELLGGARSFRESVDAAMSSRTSLLFDELLDVRRILDLLAAIPRPRVRGDDVEPVVDLDGGEIGEHDECLLRVMVRERVVVEIEPCVRGLSDLDLAALERRKRRVGDDEQRAAVDLALAYAKERQQFGKPIGSFQAIKHMCSEMLLRSQQIAVAANDVAEAAGEGDGTQLSIAAAVAAAAGIDAAKLNGRDCIQVLGGIGFTWEHDAHLYLRRAYSIAQILGGRGTWLRRVAALTRSGVRRQLDVDTGDAEAGRPEVAAAVAKIAALPGEQQQPALAEAGLMAPHWPAPFGRAATPGEQLVIDSELSAAGVVRPDISIGWWAAPTILQAGTPEQIERFIPGTLTGEVFWCQLFSEPGAGSDLAALRTKAVRVDGGWRLTGQKVWSSNAHRANWGICLARTNPDVPKHKGITYFVIDMSSPGIDIRPLREITGEALFNEVFMDDLFVPDDCVIGPVDGGWPLARTTLANERVAMAAGGALDKGMEHLLEVIGDRELDAAEAERLGALIIAAQVGSLLDQLIAQMAVGGHDPGAPSSVRKLIGVRYRQALAELIMDSYDGSGIEDSPDVRYWLNSRCLSIAGGTEQILLTVAGERLLGLPR